MSDSYVEALQAERAKIVAERARLEGHLAGLDIALRLYNGAKRSALPQVPRTPVLPFPPRRSTTPDEDGDHGAENTVKGYVFSLVRNVTDGLGSGDVLAEAERQGRPLNKKTVTSLLSASARRGELEFAQGRYRIPQGESRGVPAEATAGFYSNLEPSVEADNAARKEGGT